MVRKVAGEDIGARFSDVVESDLVDVNIGIRSMIRWIKVWLRVTLLYLFELPMKES